MRIRLNLLSLLRTLLKIAGTVQTVAELILATQGQRADDSPATLDLDAVRTSARAAGRGAEPAAREAEPAADAAPPAPNLNDPSAAR